MSVIRRHSFGFAGMLIAMASFLVGCQPAAPTAMEERSVATPVRLENAVVEAACGECQFGMEGSGCDLAIRYDGQTYFVQGTNLDDHGDAHSADGMCNAVRQAEVTGEIVDGKFVAKSFRLTDREASGRGADHEHASSDHDADVGHDTEDSLGHGEGN